MQALFTLLLLVPLLLPAQSEPLPDDRSIIHANEFQHVEVFIPRTREGFTLFYASPGGKVIDSLGTPIRNSWICMTIDSQAGNWAKLKKVYAAPGFSKLYRHLTDSWVPIEQLWLNLNEGKSSIYFHPNTDSLIAKVPSQTVNLLAIHENWAKIQVEFEGKMIEGWVSKYDQCGAPWTACNYNAPLLDKE